GGGKTNTPPVITPVPKNVTPGTPDTSYYQGDNFIQTARAGENLSLNYGVTAADPAFQEQIAAINTAIEGFKTNDQDLLERALEMNNSAAEGVNTVRARINSNIVALRDT